MRRQTRDTDLHWRVDRLCKDAYWLLDRPTAGELVRRGSTVEHALAWVDREELRIRRLLHDDEQGMRTSGLL